MNLTPEQLYYFKRELVSISLSKELDEIKQTPQTISLLRSDDLRFPLLQFLFRRLITSFPLLQNNERDLWNKLDILFTTYRQLKRNTYTPQSETILYKRLCVIALTSMIHKEDMVTTEEDLTFESEEEEEEEEEMLSDGGPDVITMRSNKFIIETDNVCVVHGYESFQQWRKKLRLFFPYEDIPVLPKSMHHPEKDRLLLRSFLKQVSRLVVVQSDIFQQFVLNNPVVLTESEKRDADERKRKELERAMEAKRFKEDVDQKMVGLEGLLNMMKEKMKQPSDLLEIFEMIKSTERLDELPDELKGAIEWGRISFAYVLYTHFVASDKAVENVANLKRTHSLMPYRAISELLKRSNPFSMIKGVLDLFFAQPFGGKSLFQRLILANMNDESEEMEKDIEELEAKVNDSLLCQKLANAVKTEKRPEDGTDLQDPVLETLAVLKNPHIQPALTAKEILKVALANQPGQEESRELVINLYELWTLYAQKYNKDIFMSLFFSGVTSELIKDIFAAFYEPMAEVYKAAHIGKTVMDVSGFLTGLIHLIDSEHRPDLFVELVQKHEQVFYSFLHNVYAKDKTRLFDRLLQYIISVFGLFSVDLQVDLDLCIQKAIKPDEYSKLKEEIEAVCDYHKENKQRHLDRKREKIMAQEGTFDFFPQSKQFSGFLSDFEDMQEDDLKLEWIPRVTPFFVVKLVQMLQ